nr:uncharacterized protein LOC109174169 [Ipomoea batatas]
MEKSLVSYTANIPRIIGTISRDMIVLSKDGVQTSDFADAVAVATEGGVRAETRDRKSQGSRSGRRRPETGTGNRAEQRTSGAMKKLSLFTLDLPDNSSPNSSAAGPSSSGGAAGQTHGKGPLPITSSSRHTNQGQDQKHSTEGGVETSTSRGIRIGEERDGSSVKDATHFRLFERPQHPCHYLGLAKQAFLKCLGLDSSSDRPDCRKHEKED